MPADAAFLVAGLALLVAVVLPGLTRKLAVSAPMVLIGLGMAIGLLPVPDGANLDPVDSRVIVEHVTEFTVLVALMGVGLALDRPLSLRRPGTFRAWGATWGLLLVTMPLTIGAVALLGWTVGGLAPATALLLGAVLAPTDPVLASDVQVEGPAVETDDSPVDERDEVRFALTSEAGLNDGLAFPFVHAAILMLTAGAVSDWGPRWLLWDLVGKVAVGVVVGVAAGWLLAKLAFRAPNPAVRTADLGEPTFALAAVFAAYGASELLGGYGFLAVFVTAMTIRSADRDHVYHRHMHEFVNRLEHLLVFVILLLLGVALTRGILGHLDARGALLGAGVVLVARPLAGAAGLWIGRRRGGRIHGLDVRERAVTAFFGVRGIGSLYYLAYAAGHAPVEGERWLWSTVTFTIVLSVVAHGVLVTPAMNWIERHREDGIGPVEALTPSPHPPRRPPSPPGPR